MLLWAGRLLAQDALFITEFLAVNKGPLLDSDGDASGWIEVYNAGTNAVNLAGWRLTDDPALVAGWTFPATNLAPDRFLIAFASGKNRALAGGELYTSFQLNRGGGYLALVKPDGRTVAHQYAPAYPPQVEGVSYGIEITTTVSPFVVAGAAARWTVPSSPSGVPAGWAGTNFDHTSWTAGQTGLGFSAGSTNGLPPGTTTNLALDRPTSQSSTLGGYISGLAVNGSLSDFTHTQAGQNLPAKWEVDLGTNCFLERIVIDNRTGCCGSRLRDITVQILSQDATTTNAVFGPLNPENILGGRTLDGPANLTLDLPNLTGGLVPGGRVRILRTPDPDLSGTGGQGNSDEADVLSMAEVEVIGTAADPLPALIQTDLGSAMLGRNASVLVRLPFVIPVEEMPILDILTLRMKYADGFVAYLNGTEVARRNAPATLAWNSHATTAHPISAALQFEDIDLTPFLGMLREGENVLAFQGLNDSASDGTFLLLPELVGKTIRGASERYFAQPTPGAVNTSSFLGFVSDTKFSVPRGFYSQPFTLAITDATLGAEIRYTTNGSPPSAVTGLLYTGPIQVNRTTVLRAIATKPGYKPSSVDTHTYVFLKDIAAQSNQGAQNVGFPSSWAGLAADYAMDTRITGPNASQMESALRSLPSLFVTTSISNLFDPNTGIYANPTSGGVAWERPASLEAVNTNGQSEFQVDCGLRIQGGYFRQSGVTHKHSLRVLFKSIYGPGKLHQDLFPGSDAAKDFDGLVLRAGANDGYAWSAAKDTEQFIRDQFGHLLQLGTGHPSSHGRFFHLYLDGLYWGLYHMVERPNEDFCSSYFGGPPEEWDSNNAGDIKNGDLQAWNTFIGLVQAPMSLANYQKLQGDNADGTRNPAYPVYLDKLNYIDYMIVNMWGGNWDWPNKNFWFGRLRTADTTGFKFLNWDFENTMGNDLSRSPTNMVAPRAGIESSWVAAPNYYLQSLPEYRMDFADRIHRFFFNNGLLTSVALSNRYRFLADSVEAAIITESARWGDDNLNPPQDQADWIRERDWILKTYLPVRSAIVLSQFRGYGLYPSVSAPVFSQHGGSIPSGFLLTISHSNATGRIYYTLDGTDPRLVGGALSATALPYTNPVALLNSTRVQARVLSGSAWSALNQADFANPDLAPLRITKVMYHPAELSAAERAAGFTNAEDFEFIELRNVGASPLSLAGLKFVDGISFTFSSGILAAGERLVLVKNQAAFILRYGHLARIGGVYGGNLNNAGERLRLEDASGRTILDFSYADSWQPITDGFGFALVIQDDTAPVSTWGAKDSWRASGAQGGSPGAEDPLPLVFPPVVVNELLASPAAPKKVSVELANLGVAQADLTGWWLTDDFRQPRKYRLPFKVLPGDGFEVFTEDDFNSPAQGTNAFTFSPSGGEVYLFSADADGLLTGYVTGWSFGATEEGVSVGRYVTSIGTGHFTAQQGVTLGSPNAGPRLSPVILSEIMYHPPELGGTNNTLDEFVEVWNSSTNAQPLFDAEAPTNTWRITGGVDYQFPPAVTLPPGGRALVVSFDPVADTAALDRFTTLYAAPAGVRLFGPFTGNLDNAGGDVELKKPILFKTGLLGYVMADKLSYKDSAPWPEDADGAGASLQRRGPSYYGNDPGSWLAAAPNAGGVSPGGIPPTIVENPVDVFVCGGSNVRFHVSATGTEPLRYQWRQDGSPIPGATNAFLDLEVVQTNQAGAYYAVIFNGAGSARSSDAVLVVWLPPQIQVQPASVSVRIRPDPAAASATNATFSVRAAAVSSLRYQWRFNGVDRAGATDQSLTITNIHMADWGEYSVEVRDDFCSAVSTGAWLYPLIQPVITQPPLSQGVPVGGQVTLSAAWIGWPPPFTVEWQLKTNRIDGAVQSDTTSFFTYTMPNTSTNMPFRLVVKNPAQPAGLASTFCTLFTLADSDGDGMPDSWEVAHGLNPLDPADAVGDSDGDGLLNWREYQAGTDPTNALSKLRLDLWLTNGVSLTFGAVSNKTYTVQFTDDLVNSGWARLADVVARTNNRVEALTDTNSVGERFYRVITPARP